jgi:hypothetical protein
LDGEKKSKFCSDRSILLVVLLYSKKKMKQIGSVLKKLLRIQF